MSSEERKQILKMVEDGKISADEAVTLMKTLDETPEAEEEVFQTEAGQGSGRNEAPELEKTAKWARSLWQIPLWIGIFVTVFTAWGMYAIQQSAGHNFWFYCLTMWLMLGVAVIALAGWSRTARWLFMNVEQPSGDWPRHIFFGFPLPIGLAGWFLRNFGHNIEGLRHTNVDEVISAISMATSATSDAPLIVNVDEGEDGERVQVYIG
jgi:hypothetical protein